MLKMRAKMEGIADGMSFKDYLNKGGFLSFGGYEFCCLVGGRCINIPFDWESHICNMNLPEDGSISLEEGTKTPLGGFPELDDIFDEEYKRLGIQREEITAKLLASAVEITEFGLDYDAEDISKDYLHILELEFEDDTGVYKVDGEVLDRFNGMELLNELDVQGDLGTYDHFTEEYPEDVTKDFVEALEEIELDDERLPF